MKSRRAKGRCADNSTATGDSGSLRKTLMHIILHQSHLSDARGFFCLYAWLFQALKRSVLCLPIC